MHWGRDGDKEDFTKVSEVSFSYGILGIRPPLKLTTGTAKSRGPPQKSPVQLVTAAPPQETAPRLPGRPQGLRPRPLSSVHHAHIGQKHRPLIKTGASGPRKAAQSLPDREPSPQSSASPPDCEQPLSTSGKNRPAIFARPTSGPSLGAAPPPETNGQLKSLAGGARERKSGRPARDSIPYSPRPGVSPPARSAQAKQPRP